jgi:LysR family glycine cleavage system transcriptional activator
VIDFAAYWFVCPPRHLNRRVVRRFSEWLAKTTTAHDTAARSFLAARGCSFQESSAIELIDVKPWGL